jgi:hypothetical protein
MSRVITTSELLVAADVLEDFGSSVCEVLRDQVQEPRELTPWEYPRDFTRSDAENRLDYLTRTFRRDLEEYAMEWAAGCSRLTEEHVDMAARDILARGRGDIHGETVE